MEITIQSVYNTPCILGEGPIWHPLEKKLYWVDIVEKKLSRVSMFNDGHCDQLGNFWVGCKDLSESKPVGDIFRFNLKDKLMKKDGNYIVSNGLISSLDSRYFYIADSPKRIIYRYDFDIAMGKIDNRKIFAKIADDAGYPDGMTIDAEGFIWSCHFNGWRITRYSPDGTIDRVIKMPTQAPSSCCFVGNDLKTLFITSAKRDVKPDDLKNQPLAGCVFAIDLEIAGVKEHGFKE